MTARQLPAWWRVAAITVWIAEMLAMPLVVAALGALAFHITERVYRATQRIKSRVRPEGIEPPP